VDIIYNKLAMVKCFFGVANQQTSQQKSQNLCQIKLPAAREALPSGRTCGECARCCGSKKNGCCEKNIAISNKTCIISGWLRNILAGLFLETGIDISCQWVFIDHSLTLPCSQQSREIAVARLVGDDDAFMPVHHQCCCRISHSGHMVVLRLAL